MTKLWLYIKWRDCRVCKVLVIPLKNYFLEAPSSAAFFGDVGEVFIPTSVPWPHQHFPPNLPGAVGDVWAEVCQPNTPAAHNAMAMIHTFLIGQAL